MPLARFSRALQRTYTTNRLRNLPADKAALQQCKRGMLALCQMRGFSLHGGHAPSCRRDHTRIRTLREVGSESRESNLIGIIGEADAAFVSDTILLSVNDKLVQMAICPTHDDCTVS